MERFGLRTQRNCSGRTGRSGSLVTPRRIRKNPILENKRSLARSAHLQASSSAARARFPFEALARLAWSGRALAPVVKRL